MSARPTVPFCARLRESANPVLLVFAVCAPLCAGNAEAADGYPTKPVRIVTAAAADSNDLVARFIGQELAARLRQPVIDGNLIRTAGIRAD